MLDSTYVHCPGVGPKTERRLWEAGARTWSDFVALGADLRLSSSQRGRLEPLVCESLARLEARDFAWFARHLPPREHWRAWPVFRDHTLYLDIETTGGPGGGALTVVGVYNGITLRQYVRGFDLEDFTEAFEDAAILVTFFGTGFDLPFLREAFRLSFPQLHIDLCFLLKRLGYSGGLKRVEEELGIMRQPGVRGLTSWDAVRLWWEWKEGSRQALDLLLAYNAEDVINLEVLLEWAYPRLLERVRNSNPSLTAPPESEF